MPNMSPSSPAERPRRIPGLLGGIAAVLTLAAVPGCQNRQAAKSAPPPTPVRVVAAKSVDVPLVANGIGTVVALEEVTIRARVRGFLVRKHFEEGALVKKDQLLLEIDPEPFQVKLDQAKASQAEAQAKLAKSVQSKAREVSKAQVGLAQATLNLSTIEERRERSLLARNATPQSEVDQKEAVRKRNEAEVAASQANLEQTIADYDVNISAAKAGVEKAQADVRDAEIELGYTKMTSPIDGRIGQLFVKVGNLVGDPNTTDLVNVRQLDPIGAEFRPSSRYLPDITKLVKTGLFVDLVLQAGMDKTERIHPSTGKVFFIDNQVDPSTSTVLLKASFANPDKSLLPGEYVRSIAYLGTRQGATVIPEQAMLTGQDGSFVYVVDDQDNTARTLVTDVDTYQGLKIVEGIKPGQRVIIEGVQLVRDKLKVAPEAVPFDPKPKSPAVATPPAAGPK